MINSTKLLTLAIVMIGFSITANAQESATASASATIITPIGITKNVDMNFGNLSVQSTTGGTVSLSAASGTAGRSVTGSVTLPSFNIGTVSAAKFTVTGQADYTYAVTLPSADVTLTRTSGTETMALNTFVKSTAGTLTLGTEEFYVGAKLTVAAAQVAGAYTTGGTPFTVTVNYN